MLLVATLVRASPIHGLGLFAAEPITKGTVIWRFAPGLDRTIPWAEIESWPDAPRDFIMRYSYVSPDFGPGVVVLNGDHARFINHADDPNTDNSTEVAIAARDIAAGEEITCDYGECCVGYDLAI
jgi:SET domain-containing protein